MLEPHDSYGGYDDGYDAAWDDDDGMGSFMGRGSVCGWRGSSCCARGTSIVTYLIGPLGRG